MLKDLHKQKHQQYPSNIFTPHYYNALVHGHDLRHNVVPDALNQKRILCSVYQISIFKINQGHITIRFGSKFNFSPNTVHCLL